MEENKINLKERVSVIRAMDTIVRSLNDGRDVLWWFEYGVPDGEINEETTDDELLWLVDDDKLFADIMSTFVKIMKRQPINGAMWVDNVLSQNKKNIK